MYQGELDQLLVDPASLGKSIVIDIGLTEMGLSVRCGVDAQTLNRDLRKSDVSKSLANQRSNAGAPETGRAEFAIGFGFETIHLSREGSCLASSW
jgi:hypothetical protein